MEIKVYNTNLEPMGIVDNITSVIWCPVYQGVGALKILVPLTTVNQNLLVRGAILVKHHEAETIDSDDVGTWRRGAQITYKFLSKDSTGADCIEVQGSFLGAWLDRRLIKNQIVANATSVSIIERLVRENMGSEAEASRQFPSFVIRPSSVPDDAVIDYESETMSAVDLAIYDRAVAADLGYDIFVDEENKQFGFLVYKGLDLTESNVDGNAPCIFSPEFDNVLEQEYIESDEDIKTSTYVEGMADEDDSAPVVEVGSDITGIERRELFTDATSLSRSYTDDDGDEITMTTEDYETLLYQAGTDSLKEYCETISFDSDININTSLTYRKDYTVGDKVTCVDKRWGIRVDTRVTAAEETNELGKESLNVTFGDALPELLQKIRKLR